MAHWMHFSTDAETMVRKNTEVVMQQCNKMGQEENNETKGKEESSSSSLRLRDSSSYTSFRPPVCSSDCLHRHRVSWEERAVCQFGRRSKKFNLHSRDATLMRRCRLRHHHHHLPPTPQPRRFTPLMAGAACLQQQNWWRVVVVADWWKFREKEIKNPRKSMSRLVVDSSDTVPFSAAMPPPTRLALCVN